MTLIDALTASQRDEVLALAAGNCKITQSLSPMQQACGVEPAIVYLAALALPAELRMPPYPVEKENLFARLQLCYHEALGRPRGGNTLFKLSPLLVPPPAIAAAAPTATTEMDSEKMAAAEQRARQAEAELLAILDREAARKPPRGGASKAAPSTRKSKQPTSAVPEPNKSAAVDVSLDELTAARGTEIEEGEFRESEWTQAKPRRGRGTGAAGRSHIAAEEPPPPPRAEEERATPTGESGRSAAPAAAPEPIDDAEEAATDATALRAAVAALEQRLAAREAAHKEELAALRAAHERNLESALRAAQEREGTRLQALQMRLYLKTTRVDALEKALAQHVAAVGLPTIAPEDGEPLSVELEPARTKSSSALAQAVAQAEAARVEEA